MQRKRLRELGFSLGDLPPGEWNAITDVAGVVVGQKTIKETDACTGITVIMPNGGVLAGHHFPAGLFAFNGMGEFTGSHWLEETGTLVAPIVFTGTHLLGLAHHFLALATRRIDSLEPFSLGVVAETWDGWLSDWERTTMTYSDLEEAIRSAKSGAVAEGNVGGGTGMICFEFKGGTGSASRVVDCAGGTYTVGALVQTNFGRREDLVINRCPVGKVLSARKVPLPWETPESDGSILAAIATDAPLTPDQCRRVSGRAALALARLGSGGEEGSGDFFLTFSTGNGYAYDAEQAYPIRMFPAEQLDPIFRGAVEAVEEAVVNSKRRKVHAIPLDELAAILKK